MFFKTDEDFVKAGCMSAGFYILPESDWGTRVKELPLFKVDCEYGYNQEHFKDIRMKQGGCGAVVACDVSIYLARFYGLDELYPFDAQRPVTEKEYVAFSKLMKPYLSPRATGIDTVEIWIDGYGRYLQDRGIDSVDLDGLHGDCSYELFKHAVTAQIDMGMLVPYLNLRHKSPDLKNFVWHWFWLAGYEEFAQETMVKVVSYGTFRWFSLKELWDTGYSRKGGLVLVTMDDKNI